MRCSGISSARAGQKDFLSGLSRPCHPTLMHLSCKNFRDNIVSSGITMVLSHPYPRNNPHHLLSCHRVHNPGHHQSGHRDEQGPEHFLTCSFFPNASIAASVSAFIASLDQLGQEHEERQEQDCSTDECQRDSVWPAKPDPDRDRKRSLPEQPPSPPRRTRSNAFSG